MESSRRVGLPPAYEDADMDALCQLIGTFFFIFYSPFTNKTLTLFPMYETALMLDRLISINDRIPLSPCVSHSPPMSWTTSADFLFCRDFLFLGVHIHARAHMC